MKWPENLNERIEKGMKEWDEKMKKEEEENKQFIKNRQRQVMTDVLQHIRANGALCDDSFDANEKNIPFTNEEFKLLFNNLHTYATEMSCLQNDEDCGFFNEEAFFYFEREKLSLFLMQGQGTFTKLSLASDEEWNEDLSFTYDEFQHYIPMILDRTATPEIENKAARNDIIYQLNEAKKMAEELGEEALVLDLTKHIKNLKTR